MTKGRNTRLHETECKDLEQLYYLKSEELSKEDIIRLQNHLNVCSECQTKVEHIHSFLKATEFDNYLEKGKTIKSIIEQGVLKEIKYSRSKLKRSALDRYLKRTLVAASLLFFIFFSAEQIKTISKISKLEDKVNSINNYANKNTHTGKLLVINHFISWDDFTKTVSNNVNPKLLEDKLNYIGANRTRQLKYGKKLLIENKDLVIELLGKTDFDFPFIKGFKELTSINGKPK